MLPVALYFCHCLHAGCLFNVIRSKVFFSFFLFLFFCGIYGLIGSARTARLKGKKKYRDTQKKGISFFILWLKSIKSTWLVIAKDKNSSSRRWLRPNLKRHTLPTAPQFADRKSVFIKINYFLYINIKNKFKKYYFNILLDRNHSKKLKINWYKTNPIIHEPKNQNYNSSIITNQ